MKNLQNNLNIQEIQKNLKYKHNIEIFDSIDSTNKYLKSKINEKNYGTIVISNEQTNGYGKMIGNLYLIKILEYICLF